MYLNKKDVESRVVFLVKETIEDKNLETSEIDLTTPLVAWGIDSLQMVAFIVALEKEFSIKYPPSFINTEQFENIQIIVKNIVTLRSMHSYE